MVARVLPEDEVLKVAMRTEVRGCATTEEEKEDLLIDPARERARLAAKTELPPHWFEREDEWRPVTGGTWRHHDHINLGEARGGLETCKLPCPTRRCIA